MPRYPKQPLEEKLAWMRERQRAKEEARQKEAADGQQVVDHQQQITRTEAMLLDLLRKITNPPVIRERQDAPAERKMRRVPSVAAELAVSDRTVQRWFADCAIIVRAGPRKTTMLIPQQALDDWYREHQAKPQAKRR